MTAHINMSVCIYVCVCVCVCVCACVCVCVCVFGIQRHMDSLPPSLPLSLTRTHTRAIYLVGSQTKEPDVATSGRRVNVSICTFVLVVKQSNFGFT